MIATKAYDWRGDLIGFQCDEHYSWVPVEPTLHAYRDLMQKIAARECILQEPHITNVEKAYNRKHVFNGYLYSGMFIPLDNANYLCSLIETSIQNGICRVSESVQHKVEMIDSYRVCVTFQSPWRSLESIYEADIAYPTNDKAAPNDYHVRYFNLSMECSDELDLLSKYYSTHNPYPSPIIRPQFRLAILEISIPVKQLRSIFRIQKKLKTLPEFILDMCEMHLQHTDRSQKEGPSVDWLIQYFPMYSYDVVADIGNRAITAISLDGWDETPKYISQKYYSENHIIYKIHSSGKEELAYFQLNKIDNKFLSGAANVSSTVQHANETQSPQFDYAVKYKRLPLLRIRQLMSLGLTVEAISLLNSYLEVTFKHMLWKCLLNNSSSLSLKSQCGISAINGWGYKKSLEVIREVVDAECLNAACTAIFRDYLEKAKSIYKHRNLYLHDLELPDNKSLISHALRTSLEILMNTFVEPYSSHQFEIALDIFSIDCEEKQMGIIDKHVVEWVQAKKTVKKGGESRA